MIRTYRQLQKLDTIEARYEYLRLNGKVSDPTFGYDRWLNQRFYTSAEWRNLRHQIIVRDNGCDLGVEGYEIHRDLFIHHMNPISVDQLKHHDDSVLDPEYLITVAFRTHNAIHYGDSRQLPSPPTVRRAGDTKLW